MKRYFIILVLIIFISPITIITLKAIKNNSSSSNIDTENSDREEVSRMKVIIDNKEYNVELEDSETSKSLLELLPLELEMKELNGNEKYHYLDISLPTDKTNLSKINKGDLMLYTDNCLVLFYKSFTTSYSYTKIGHIDNLPDLDNNDIKITFTT